MRLNKFVLVGIVVALIAVVSTGCSDRERERWRASTLDFGMSTNRFDRDGFFEIYKNVDRSFLSNFNPSREDIVGANVLNSWIIFPNTSRYDRVEDIIVEIEGIGEYQLLDAIPDRNGSLVIDRDANLDKFFDDLTYHVSRNRAVRVYISGYFVSAKRELFVDFGSNMNILVRD